MEIIWLGCVLTLHTPAGTQLLLESRHITVFQPLPKTSEQHVAAGTKTIVHTGGQKFGVTESVDDINALLEQCGED